MSFTHKQRSSKEISFQQVYSNHDQYRTKTPATLPPSTANDSDLQNTMNILALFGRNPNDARNPIEYSNRKASMDLNWTGRKLRL